MVEKTNKILYGFMRFHIIGTIAQFPNCQFIAIDIFGQLLAGLLRVPVVYLIYHSSVVTMSQEHSLLNFTLLGPKSADIRH